MHNLRDTRHDDTIADIEPVEHVKAPVIVHGVGCWTIPPDSGAGPRGPQASGPMRRRRSLQATPGLA